MSDKRIHTMAHALLISVFSQCKTERKMQKRKNVKVTLSNPIDTNFRPSESPIPAKSVTGFSPIGSDTKHRHTSTVFDITTLVQWSN